MALPRIRWAKDGTVVRMIDTTGSIISTLNASQMLKMDGLATSSDYYAWSSNFGMYVAFNFPGPIQIDRVVQRIRAFFPGCYPIDTTYSTSSDSTNGFDGTWTPLGPTVTITSDPTCLVETALTPTVCTWFRLFWDIGVATGAYVHNIQLFGEYQSPRFEYWNAAGDAELDATKYPLSFPDASNASDVSQYIQFRLKNVDSISHDYSISISSVSYASDPVIADRMSLSKDGGTTKATTISVTGIAAGALSGLIDIWEVIPKTSNPADGYHWFTIDVVETA